MACLLHGYTHDSRSYPWRGFAVLDDSAASEVRELGVLRILAFSNSSWIDGMLFPNYRKPFDLIVEASKMHDERAVGAGEKFNRRAPNGIWLPFLDQYRTFVSVEPNLVARLVKLLAA